MAVKEKRDIMKRKKKKKKTFFIEEVEVSELEFSVWKYFKDHNKVTVLATHPIYVLQEKFDYEDPFTLKTKYAKTRTCPEVIYTPDIKIRLEGYSKDIVVEVKGYARSEYRLRKKIFLDKYIKDSDKEIFIQLDTLKQTKEIFDKYK